MKIVKSSKRRAEGVHLWLLLTKATKALETYARRSVEKTGLGLTDFGVLEALFHKGPLPVNALRQKVLISSGSMSTAVDRLERSGLVERVATQRDRRSRVVHLTGQGKKLISGRFREHARDMERAFSCLGKDERNVLASLLRKLGHGAEELTNFKGNQTAKKRRS